jgi:rubrerythrin
VSVEKDELFGHELERDKFYTVEFPREERLCPRCHGEVYGDWPDNECPLCHDEGK